MDETFGRSDVGLAWGSAIAHRAVTSQIFVGTTKDDTAVNGGYRRYAHQFLLLKWPPHFELIIYASTCHDCRTPTGN